MNAICLSFSCFDCTDDSWLGSGSLSLATQSTHPTTSISSGSTASLRRCTTPVRTCSSDSNNSENDLTRPNTVGDDASVTRCVWGDDRPVCPLPGLRKLVERVYHDKLLSLGVSRFFPRQVKRNVILVKPFYRKIEKAVKDRI
ncbi:hypothetical protein LIER_29009 [Lithospermum erythrorhizon]|uniref:Uncharacterized protein n=1 Tax=Lithospermum erythrorhizon TaxID=34254 RepID=A0AAV3RLB9_LITER